ncbi:MAG: tetratricopeptide repeat protein [Fuerstiella sp.]
MEQRQFSLVQGHIDSLKRNSHSQRYVHLLEGGLLLRRDRYEAALRELVQISPTGKIRPDALVLTGECLYRLGRLDEAADLIQQLSDENPWHATARRWLAAIHYDEGRLDSALMELQEVSRLRPDDYSPHRMMGMIHHQDLRNEPTAVNHYRIALQLNPPTADSQQILNELSEALIEQGKYREALKVLDQANGDSHFLSLKARCHWQLQEREQARAVLAQVLTIAPGHRAGLMLQSRIHLDERQPKAAIASLQKILDQDPHDFPCRYQLALVYLRLGDRSESAAQMARMRQSKEFRTRLAELFVKARRPGDVEVRREIAQLCMENDQPQLATIWREAAAESGRAKPILELGPEWKRQSEPPRGSTSKVSTD